LAAKVNLFIGEAADKFGNAGEQAINTLIKTSKAMNKLSADAVEDLTTMVNDTLEKAMKKAEAENDKWEKLDAAKQIEAMTTAIKNMIDTIADAAQKAEEEVKKAMKDAADATEGAVSKAMSDAISIGNALMDKASAAAKDIGKRDVDGGKSMDSNEQAFDDAVTKTNGKVTEIAELIPGIKESATGATGAEEVPEVSASGSVGGDTKSTGPTGGRPHLPHGQLYDSRKDPNHPWEHIRVSISL